MEHLDYIIKTHKIVEDAVKKAFEKRECAIKGCDKLGIKQWNEFGDMLVCESHYEIMAKHIGEN